jgi:hypothetical protein
MGFSYRDFSKYLIDLGVFRYIETKRIEKCRLIVPFLFNNVFMNEHNQLLAVGYPNGILFVLYASNL